MIKIDDRKLKKEFRDLMLMRKYAIDERVPYEKSVEIRKEQQKKYDKYVFKKKLKEIVERGEHK